MSDPVKLPLLGRAARVRNFQEAQEQVDFIRAKIDSIILGLGNLDSNISSQTGGSGTITAVNSIAANGGAKRTGDLTFTDTSSITMAQSGQDFRWNIATLPSTVFATPAVTYGTIYAAGAASTAVRTDAQLKFPSALMETVSSKTLTLTDDGTYGALLTQSSGFSSPVAITLGLSSGARLVFEDSGSLGAEVIPLGTWAANVTSIFAPTGTQPFQVGPTGTVATGGSGTDNNVQLRFSASLSSATLQEGINLSITNTGTGAVRGSTIVINNASASASAVALTGEDVTVQAGGAGATGIMVGYKATMSMAGAATRTQANFFNVAASTLSGTITGVSGLLFTSPTGGTVTNLSGLNVSGMQTGTNRRGVWVQGSTTGTPTLSIGVDVSSLTVGTDRWAFRGAQKFENTGTDMICSTAAKGLITKDTQGTARYWRTYMDATGTVGGTMTLDENENMIVARGATPTGSIISSITDVGTSLPTS